jgi:outer membrane receptor protein involved in Fe transport
VRVSKFILIFISISVFVHAQAYKGNRQKAENGFAGSVKGIVIDSTTNAVVPFANVMIFNDKDSSIASGAVTNNEGVFTISGVKPGRYFVKISFIGYKLYQINNVNINGKNLNVNLGTVKIIPSSVKLKTVVVNGQQEMVTTNLDKQVIDVSKDLSSSGGTALDVMQNIPALTVDIDGNISLRGNSNVTILIDGKPSGLSGINSSDVLTQIPSSSIKSIELVTNPSAKYDPDGTAGIINIVLKKKSNMGFNGVFNLNGGTGSKYTGGTNFNYRTGVVNFFGDISGRAFQFNRTGLSDRTNFYNGIPSYINQSSLGKYNMGMFNAQVGMDFLLDDYNTISASVQFRHFNMDNTGSIYNNLMDNSLATTDYYVNNNSGSRNVKSMMYSLDYKRDYDEKGKSLTADIIYTNNSMLGGQYTDNNYFVLNDTSAEIPPSLINYTTNNTHKNLIVQSDFIQPFNDQNKIDIGFKSSIENLGMAYNYYNYANSTGAWIIDPTRTDNYNYTDQIHAIYGIYMGGIGNFKYEAGIRGEDEITKFNLTTNSSTYNRNYISIYPSVYFAYDFSPLDEIKISYSRRVDRPRIWQLNPFINYSDSLNLSKGNPALMPEYTNSYELGYNTDILNISLYSSLFYKETSGLITRISDLIGNGVTMSTFENIASQKNYGAELVGSGSIFKWWKYNANVSYFRTDINDPLYVTAQTNYSYSWTGRINSTWMLDKTFSIQVSSTYNSPTINPQGKTNSLYFTDFAMKKDFMNGNLSVTFRVSDIFNTRRYSSQEYGTGFVLNTQGWRDSRIFYLGFTFNLNNYKQKKDNTEKEINTDDQMDVE